MNGVVGNIDWGACDRCRHFRHDVGGCNPLEETADIIVNDLVAETVECERFEEVKP